MGTTLNGTTPQNTYPSLIKVGDNGPLSATAKILSDGEGNDSILALSTTAVGIGTNAPTATTHIKGSGTTSATTSLLVQNSAGTSSLRVSDDNNVFITKAAVGGTLNISNGGNFGISIFGFQNSPVIGANVSIAFGRYTTSATQGALTTTTLFLDVANSRVAIGNTSPSASSILDVSSTTQGFLPPRMTTTQKNAISSPASGLQVYDTTLNQMSYYNGTSWINF